MSASKSYIACRIAIEGNREHLRLTRPATPPCFAYCLNVIRHLIDVDFFREGVTYDLPDSEQQNRHGGRHLSNLHASSDYTIDECRGPCNSVSIEAAPQQVRGSTKTPFDLMLGIDIWLAANSARAVHRRLSIKRSVCATGEMSTSRMSRSLQPFDRPTVFATHDAPHALTIPQRSRKGKFEPAVATNVELFTLMATIWIHGQLNGSSDYDIGDCRVICTPPG